MYESCLVTVPEGIRGASRANRSSTITRSKVSARVLLTITARLRYQQCVLRREWKMLGRSCRDAVYAVSFQLTSSSFYKTSQKSTSGRILLTRHRTTVGSLNPFSSANLAPWRIRLGPRQSSCSAAHASLGQGLRISFLTIRVWISNACVSDSRSDLDCCFISVSYTHLTLPRRG